MAFPMDSPMRIGFWGSLPTGKLISMTWCCFSTVLICSVTTVALSIDDNTTPMDEPSRKAKRTPSIFIIVSISMALAPSGTPRMVSLGSVSTPTPAPPGILPKVFPNSS